MDFDYITILLINLENLKDKNSNIYISKICRLKVNKNIKY